ncbi:alpha-hydroxy acid oxidase [Amycolatopsis sp. CA-230715]|uniref:alpha-hydroxy acid oxidase n=1 Tax=Amycolatopsis sp. CA-230715 TaxID=2745196 RepID=UPI001C02B29C|nr:alpha-hydroxy acid oxidase [Amycolatopsis sp. CA-230715]QWF84118.1 4-hydroxymandelate oxidase [Amycolatopsis sp. CA-230715]
MDLTALMTLADFEEATRTSLDRASWAYLSGGAGSERSIRANAAAYEDVWLRPRVLSGADDQPKTGVSVLGHHLAMPVVLGPTSPQRILHDEAELATARAAQRMGTLSVVSSDTHYAFPDIAKEGGDACWFQVYPYQSLACVDAMVDMAQAAGAKGIVVTVDAYYRPQRISARRAGFRMPESADFGTLRMLGILTGDTPADARLDRIPLTWPDLERIRSRLTVPMVVKGVLSPEDAQRCVDIGAEGIVVSNHGGRQLDGVVPTLPALAAISARVRDQCALLVDGGIRSGADVVKALALGARAVCIGRPYLWGLRLAGQAGVEAVLTMLHQEIENILLQLGLGSVDEVGPDCVVRADAAAHLVSANEGR